MSKRTLEDFFDAVRSNQRANRVAYPQSYAIIERIDDYFARAGSNLVNPTPMMTGALFLRCHYAFKTAAGMAFAGQAAEVFSVLRSVLEYAGYCLVIWETPTLEGVFVLRHAGDLEMREQKKAFQGKGVTEAIARQDANLANCYSDMYQRTIDFGAHPNPHATFSTMSMEQSGGQTTTNVLALTSEPRIIAHALKSTAQIGLTALHVLECVFRPKFELLGIRRDMDALAGTGAL